MQSVRARKTVLCAKGYGLKITLHRMVVILHAGWPGTTSKTATKPYGLIIEFHTVTVKSWSYTTPNNDVEARPSSLHHSRSSGSPTHLVTVRPSSRTFDVYPSTAGFSDLCEFSVQPSHMPRAPRLCDQRSCYVIGPWCSVRLNLPRRQTDTCRYDGNGYHNVLLCQLCPSQGDKNYAIVL